MFWITSDHFIEVLNRQGKVAVEGIVLPALVKPRKII